MRPLEDQLKHLIVDALMLDDVQPQEIDTDAALFVDGLGLDSVDALELAIAIERQFGVKIEPKTADAPKIFASVATLAAFIRDQPANTNGNGASRNAE